MALALDFERKGAFDAETAVLVHLSLLSRVNYASYLNSVPILRELCIENRSESPLTDIAVQVEANPDVLVSRRWLIEKIGPGERLYIDELDIQLNAGMLWNLNEAITADVSFSVSSADRVFAKKHLTIEVLARNEWAGATVTPELLSAFVNPNDPAVEQILKDASQILHKNGLLPGIDGYQSGTRQRAAQIVGAIWSAVCSRELDYSAPPASFERDGQKIRTPSHIIESGLGTCLDLTLLFAACIEQAGMNPLIILQRGHSLVGCWLQSEQFADVLVDDPASLRNRLGLGEILLFETTLATHRPAPAFSAAVDSARKALAEENDSRFVVAIDIRRARMQRIRPVPAERPDDHDRETRTETVEQSWSEIELDVPRVPDEISLITEGEILETPESRLERWQRKLLDLSLRNRLLNFRPGKGAVTICCPDPDRFEDLLAEGHRFDIRPLPETFRSDDGEARRDREEVIVEYARDGLDRKEIYVDLPPQELDVRLVELYRKARAGLEEGGANILYLAMGFLVWRQGEDKRERALRAPLVLIPVTLERRSVRSPMRLMRHDDEARVNPTLLQMLEKDFAIRVPELAAGPIEDESGLDIPTIWNVIRKAIREMKGWEVSEEVVLSTFSFSKYLMWKDLTERLDQVKANRLVRHLLEKPREPYSSNGSLPEPAKLDEQYSPEQSFTLLPADSSQLAAIMAVMSGNDLVIEGPPGTGKSQTITNIIAQCLAAGRTVLFVSEKRAALDVVYRRLKDVGLGDFCLELHSNRARKTEVLEQLKRAWESQGSLDQGEWSREASRLARLRDSLNHFVKELHRVYPNGYTPFQAMGVVVRDKEVPHVRLSWTSPDVHDCESLDELRELVHRIDAVSAELEGVAGHPLVAIQRTEWSEAWRSGLIDAIDQTLRTVDALGEKVASFIESLKIPRPAQQTKHEIDAVVNLADVLSRAHGRTYGFSFDPDASLVIEAMDEALSILDEWQTEVSFLSAEYSRNALATLDIDELAVTWKKSRTARWPLRLFMQHKVLKALSEATPGASKPNVENDLPRLQKIRALERQLDRLDESLRRLGRAWNGVDSDIGHLKEVREDAARLRSAIVRLYPTPDEQQVAQDRLRYLLTEGNHLLAADAGIGHDARALIEAFRSFSQAVRRLCELAGASLDKLCPPAAPDWPSEIRRVLEGWRAHSGRLRTWCAWRKLREEAIAKGLQPLVVALEAGEVSPGAFGRVFEVNYCRWWSGAVFDRSEVLRAFIAAEHEHRIEEFRRLDDRFAKLTRDYIRARICSQIPRRDEGTLDAEWGLLSRELQKKTRHMPIRKMMMRMPNVLMKLTPCFLMSPLSIAQYLPPDQALFDVVIFDEASQIPPWDAIGAIARGRQTVIVGDSKQLPPTTFFERTDDDEFAEDLEEDLESILDECLGAQLPKRSLTWHYRSKHESLIAFSNHRYYDDTLVTFPSPFTEDRAVSFRYVPEGLYEAGTTRVNKPEARALVEEILARLRDPDFQQERPTIGIVTFNAQQQKLIEDLLDEERRKDPSLELWFSEELAEPLMIKNLENVQGDERDIIYFSITYGPDQLGRISMNFGPLNRDGGERRLNVAITRARREMRVFSSLRAEQIDLTRTQSQGVHDLKRFLEYAEHGARVFIAAHPTGDSEPESPFEEAVAIALRERGWVVHPQVGVSRFRVDLGVVDPDAPGRYLAGVECDGATYHRSANARDRDKLREAKLRDLGWKIVRVWSTDWWTDPQGALERLDSRLREILEESRKARADFVRSSSQTSEALNVDRQKRADVHVSTRAYGNVQKPIREAITSSGTETWREEDTNGEDSVLLRSLDKTIESTSISPPSSLSYRFVPYRRADLSSIAVDSSRFYDPDYIPVLRELITAIVQTEGPIRDELLVRRIARIHGFQRTGGQIRNRVLSLAKRQFMKSREDIGEFFWPDQEAIRNWRVFREVYPDDDRTLGDIPFEELKVLAHLVLAQGYDGEDALRRMAAYCGIVRLTGNIRSRLQRALDYARGPKGVTERTS